MSPISIISQVHQTEPPSYQSKIVKKALELYKKLRYVFILEIFLLCRMISQVVDILNINVVVKFRTHALSSFQIMNFSCIIQEIRGDLG